MGTPRGWGGGSSATAMQLIDLQRPHPITVQPLLSPPAWLACASQRPWGPGIRLESRFQECHLPLLMVLIIGTGWRAGSGGAEADSLLRLPPQRCSTREAGQSWRLAGAGRKPESSTLCGLPCRCLLRSRALAESWRTGSDGVRGCQIPGVRWRPRGEGRGWEVPAPRFATLYHAKSLPVWDPKPLSLTRKGGPCCPTCFQSRTPQEAGTLTPCPEKPGRASPQWAQALLGAWPEEVLRGLHCPCTSTTTAATPQLCCHHHHCSGPSVTSLHRTQHSLSQLQQHHHSARGQSQALERLQLLCYHRSHIATPLCLSSSSYKWG